MRAIHSQKIERFWNLADKRGGQEQKSPVESTRDWNEFSRVSFRYFVVWKKSRQIFRIRRVAMTFWSTSRSCTRYMPGIRSPIGYFSLAAALNCFIGRPTIL